MKKLLFLSLLIFSARGATLVSCATGNLTGSSWCAADATALNYSEAASTQISTSNLDSNTFVLPATQLNAVCVDISSRDSTTGTLTITLRNSTGATNVISVAINLTDIDAAGNGWYCVSGSNHTPNGTDSYLVRLVCSSSNCAKAYASSGNNWSRFVVYTATTTPAANDNLHMVGYWTAAATQTTFTITMDQTATTSFGSTTPPQSITVNKGATFTWGTTASTTYKLAHAGIFACYGGATVNVGTSGTRMPSTSSGTWTATVASNVDSGWVIAGGCTFNAYGATKTTISTLMTADKVGGNTVIALASTSGFANGDTLAFSSTTRTPSQAESKVISTVDSGTQVTLTAGLTNAHSGTSPTQAEVINLTRNVVFTGTSTSLQGYLVLQSTANFHADYAEFKHLGSATTNKRGIDIQTTSGGTASFNACSIHDFIAASSRMFYISGSASNGASLSSNVWYNSNAGWLVDFTTGTYSISGNVFIASAAGGGDPVLSDLGGIYTNNIISSAGANCLTLEGTDPGPRGTFSGNTFHSCGVFGIVIQNTDPSQRPYILTDTTVWRNGNAGLFTGAFDTLLTLDGTNNFFGNGSYSILFNGGSSKVTIYGLTSNGDSTFATANGVYCVNGCSDLRIINSTFSVVSGIKTAHTTTDIVTGTAGFNYSIYISGSNLANFSYSASVINIRDPGSFIAFNNYGGTAGDNRIYWAQTGTVTTDTSIFRTASPSARLTPTSASKKLEGGWIYIPIASGVSTATLSAYVRTSVVGDGAAYNGNTPRLVILANPQAGSNYNTDNVCATGGGSGSFSQISCTLPATTGAAVLVAYVDADGTAGWVNVSDIAVSTTAPSIGNPTYFNNGLMFIGGATSAGGGGSFTFLQ